MSQQDGPQGKIAGGGTPKPFFSVGNQREALRFPLVPWGGKPIFKTLNPRP